MGRGSVAHPYPFGVLRDLDLVNDRENIIDKRNYFAIIKHFVLALPDK
jgi:hypothetical protein